MHTVFLDADTLGDDLDWQALNHAIALPFRSYPMTRPDQVAERLQGARWVISNKVVLDRDMLATAPHLRGILVAATGVNNIDLDAARERGLTVCNVRGYGTASVAQHVWSLILALTTHLAEYSAASRDGRWGHSPHFCWFGPSVRELSGKTLGIIGHGELGRAVAKIAEAFGMHVLIAERRGHPPRPGRHAFEQVLQASDVISLHCPLNAETHHLIGPSAFAAMRPDSLLINCARGGVVDEAALSDALHKHTIAGAASDVLSQEPPDKSHPLFGAPRLLLTPHSAWLAREARQRIVQRLAEQLIALDNGNPIDVVL